MGVYKDQYKIFLGFRVLYILTNGDNNTPLAIYRYSSMKVNSLFIRYILVGMMNTAFGYTIFALLVFSGLQYPIALFFATISGILFNFKTFGRFVFKQLEWRLIWRFLTVYGILYAVNVCGVFVLMKYICNVYIANAVTLVFIAGLGFLLNRSFVYANH